MRPCSRCQVDITGAYRSAKYCRPCAAALVKRPKSTMTEAQKRKALRLRGELARHLIVERLGITRASFSRFARDSGLSFDTRKYKPELIREVVSFYAEHGFAKTKRQFPDTIVRSIIDCNTDKFTPRQNRWSSKQLAQVVRMVGFVPFEIQAKIINRPNAYAGSIKSVWNKRLAVNQALHGLRTVHAKHILTDDAPYVIIPNLNGTDLIERRLYLWCDARHCIRPGTPMFIRQGIRAMAKFQAWIYAPNDARQAILKMLRQNKAHDS